jgi:hypothetical protein
MIEEETMHVPAHLTAEKISLFVLLIRGKQ